MNEQEIDVKESINKDVDGKATLLDIANVLKEQEKENESL